MSREIVDALSTYYTDKGYIVSNPGYKDRCGTPEDRFFLLLVLCNDNGLTFMDESYKFVKLSIIGDDVMVTYKNYNNLDSIKECSEHLILSDPELFDKIDGIIKYNV